MISNVELDLELEHDIKNLKSMLDKYTNLYKKAQLNFASTKDAIFNRLGFVLFQFKNVYVKGDWF